MKKVIVHAIEEWMDVIALLKSLTSSDGLEIHISKYIKSSDYTINYYEYEFIRMIYPKIFEKYTFSLHSHGKNYSCYYLQEKLIDSMTRFSYIYEFSVDLSTKTEHLLIWNERWVDFVIKTIRNEFNIDKIYHWLLKYREVVEMVPSSIYYYANILFLLHLSQNHEIAAPDKWMVRLSLEPRWCLQSSWKKVRKITYDCSFLSRASHFLNLINEEAYENLIFITKDRASNKRKIDFFKNHFLMSKWTWVSVKIHKPLDSMNIKLSENNLFIIFEDSKEYFNRLSYFKNHGILCLDE